MANEIKMPQLSDTMHSGKILAWKKKEGDAVARGDILAEVETEKANLEIESFSQGTLLKILVPALTAANVGEVIAIIGEKGEQVSAPSSTNGANKSTSSTPTPKVEMTSSPIQSPQSQASYGSSDRVKASPLARKIAEQKNIDITNLRGSGPDGRIVKKDVEHASPPVTSPSQNRPTYQSTQAASPSAQSTTGNVQSGSGRSSPLSKMREVIARRMQESVTQSPHFYTTTKINMGESKKLYSALKEREDFKGLGLNHLIIKAAAYALSKERRVNNAMRDNMLYEPESINIGIITAIDDGLLIPVIKDTNLLSLRDLAFEARAAIERARAGRPSSADLSGGTFSISNMGMFDVENFTAIINPGQGAVLAVSSTKEEPIVCNGQIVIGLIMKATLSVDHRIIDGVMAATFLKHFKEALELPALLMLQE